MNISLTTDEALVFFEFWTRFNKAEHTELFEDQAEQRILWDLECMLERELTEPFIQNYPECLARARANVRDEI